MPRIFVFLISLLFIIFPYANAQENDADASQLPVVEGVTQFQLDSSISQVQSEIRAQRDLTAIRLNNLENEIKVSASYTERLLFGFMLAAAFVVFVVLLTLNKQSSVNNEKMRNLIREADNALDDLHRLMDRPEAEHFHLSRNLSRIMNKFRERENPSLPQKDISDIYAAAEDPTLPVTLHMQANALQNELKGKWEEAILLWERLLKLDSANPEILLHLAQNYKKLSEISAKHSSEKLRLISLDYFQKYSHRTSLHTHSERELRKSGDIKVELKEEALINKQIRDLQQHRDDGKAPPKVVQPEAVEDEVDDKQLEEIASTPAEEYKEEIVEEEQAEPHEEITAATEAKPEEEVAEEKETAKDKKDTKKKKSTLAKTLLGFGGKKDEAKDEEKAKDELDEEELMEDEELVEENEVTDKTTSVEDKAKEFIDDILAEQPIASEDSGDDAGSKFVEELNKEIEEDAEPEKSQQEIERENLTEFFSTAFYINVADMSLQIKDNIIATIKDKEEQQRIAEQRKQEELEKARQEQARKEEEERQRLAKIKAEELEKMRQKQKEAEEREREKARKLAEEKAAKEAAAREREEQIRLAEQKKQEEKERIKQEAMAKAKLEQERKDEQERKLAEERQRKAEEKAAQEAKVKQQQQEKELQEAKAAKKLAEEKAPKETVSTAKVKEEKAKVKEEKVPVTPPKPAAPEEVNPEIKPVAKPVVKPVVKPKPVVAKQPAKVVADKPKVLMNQKVEAHIQSVTAVNNANGGKSELSQEMIDKAFKSRTDKANDHFRRFAEAKTTGDKIQWLEAAAEEYKEAYAYKTNEHLFRFWGATMLEIANLDTDNGKDYVRKSVEIYKEGNEKHDHAFINEIALCYAKLQLENNCQESLQIAKEKNLLDNTIINEQPEFEQFKSKEWFSEYLS